MSTVITYLGSLGEYDTVIAHRVNAPDVKTWGSLQKTHDWK